MVQDYTFVQGSLDEVVAQFARNRIFSLDLETTGLSPLDSRILLCQIGFPESTYVIDLNRTNLTPLMPFFRDPKWRVIIQRSEFERKFIQHNYGVQINNVYDTYLAEKVLLGRTAPSSLEFMAEKYTDMRLDKSVRGGFVGARPKAMFTQKELQYAADDAIVLFKIMEPQAAKIKELGLERIAELEFDVATVVANMELVGVPIRIRKWKELLKETEQEHEESRLKMNSLLFDGVDTTEQLGMFVRDAINLNSPKQLKAAFANIGIDLEATNEREISLVDHPAAKELLNYRGLEKTLSSYGDSFLNHIHPFTGRIHAEFQQLGTDTGRFSCKDPNLQQIPEKFRECIGADDYSIIAADYSQIELRILAELSQDPGMVNAFQSGEDLHKSTAATMFNIPIDTVTKEQRFIAKTINFGLAYGMGGNKLRDMLNAEAEKNGTKKYGQMQTRTLMAKYRSAYRLVVEWLDDAGARAYRQGYSETMYGRKRFYERPAQGIDEESYDKQIGGIKRQGANAPIQGTNADITKLAMIDIQRELKNNGFSADIINQVHDEIVILARKDEAEAVKIMTINSMVESAQVVLKTVPVKVEAYVSDIWKKG